MMEHKLLLVDDDRDLLEMLCSIFRRAGYTDLVTASSGPEALQAWREQQPALIVLDVMMPGEDGFALCRRIRGLADCPILFLTAKTEEADVLTGLGLGGDDYLTKPFRVAELRARVAAHLRREQRTPHARLRRGALDFDLGERAVYWKDTSLKLTKGEYAICEYLAMHPGQTFSKEQLYEAAFGYDGEADASAVTEHIKNIRAKLRPAGESPIETVWGVGYKWKNG